MALAPQSNIVNEAKLKQILPLKTLFLCMSVLCANIMCASCDCSVPERPKAGRASDPLGLGLHVIIDTISVLGIEPGSSTRAANALSH